MREWLTVIIALLILGILLDGVRRMRAHRRDSLRMSRKMVVDHGPVVEERQASSEFPSGGARVAARRDPDDIEHINQHLKDNYAASRMTRGAPNRIPEQVSLNLDSLVPMLMDSVDDNERHKDDVTEADAEPTLGDFTHLDDGVCDANQNPSAEAEVAESKHSPEGSQSQSSVKTEMEAKADKVKHQPAASDVDPSPEEDNGSPDSDQATASQLHRVPDEVLIINVMARRGYQFNGAQLLDALVSQNLKFGDMDIFHRHEEVDGHGKILYSVANIVVPGTFELGAMEDFQTPGISMFLSLPVAGDSITAFNLMADSAQAIAKQLDGELKDEHRSVMTRQTIEHSRQRVVEYERKRRLSK